VNGITTTFGRDADEQPTSQTFTWGSNNYNLTYQYDLDDRLMDEGGSSSLAVINLPARASDTYSYNGADQIATVNGISVQYELASDDVNYDPTTGDTFTYNARAQVVANSNGPSNTYDALGRRNMLTYGSCTNGESYLLHEGMSVSGYGCATSFGAYLTPPGGGAPSSLHLTQPGYSDWQVPLNDIFGSTLAVIDTNLSQVVNSYTYDPNGVMNTPGPLGGSSSKGVWGFLYQGLESEYPDAQKLYWEPNGNIYNPDPFQLSPNGPDGIGGGGGGFPRSIGGHLSSQDANLGLDFANVALDTISAMGGIRVWGFGGFDSEFPLNIFTFGLFGGGSGAPTIPWYNIVHTQRGAHDVYCRESGICDPIVTQQSSFALSVRQLIPNVTIGVSSPIGGVQTTLPFHSGGDPITVQRGGSFNFGLPILPLSNLSIFPEVQESPRRQVSIQFQVSTPFGGYQEGLTIFPAGQATPPKILGPRVNFGLPFGTNLYLGTSYTLNG
jgi:hypothetical protein